MNGYEVTRQIREYHEANKCPEPYIVALTASNATDGRRELIQAGMKDFIPKPAKRGNFEAAFVKYFEWSKERTHN